MSLFEIIIAYVICCLVVSVLVIVAIFLSDRGKRG